jgi:large repetitive protein
MIKRLFSIPTWIVVLMLMHQFLFPIGNVLVSASTSMLPPSNLAYQSLTPEDGKLTWSSVFGATGYNVYEIKEGQMSLLGKVTTTTYNLNDLPEGSYRYVISTLSGEGESGPSAPVSAEIVYPDMQAPASLTSTIKNGNDIVLNWGTSPYVQKYHVYQISETGEKTLLTATSGRSYTIAGAAEGSYKYAVSVYHSLYGESDISSPVEVNVTYPAMQQPQSLSFTITNGTDVTLKWQAAEFATNYKIYEVVNGQLNLKSTVTGTSVKYTNLPAGDYVYKVYSNSDRFGESAEGSEVSLTVSSIVMVPPSDVTYKIQNTNDVILSWGTVPYATAYKVYQVINGERVLKSTITGTSVSYSMLPGGNYEYEIYSYSDRFGESELGSKVTFTIETVKVNPPSNLSFKIQNGNDIVLTWSAAENANNYKIYQIVDGQKVLKSTVTGTTITYTNMPAGDYQFEVHTNSTRFGESVEASTISFSLEQINLSAPGNASYEIRNGNDLTLSWETVEYATSYKVYQLVDGKKVLKTTVSTPTATFTNLPEGVYEYQIHANSSRFGESKEGANVKINLVHPKLNPPTNVTKTIKNPTDFTISWDAVEYATSYKVYQVVNGQKILKSNTAGLIVTYSNMSPGQYTYEVYSYSTRYGESQLGTPIEVTLNGQTMLPPANLTYSINNVTNIALKWDAVQYAANYRIYQIVDGEEVLKTTVSGTNYTFTNLSAGEYQYVVKSYSSLFGESPQGSEVKVSIVYPEMSKPGNLAYKLQNFNDVVLTWESVPYATGYKVYEVVGEEEILKTTVSALSTTLSMISEGHHTYKVRSYSTRFGESKEASEVSLTVVYPELKAPDNLVNIVTNGNDLNLSWSSVPYANNYKVYQVIDGEKILKATTGTSTVFANMPEGEYHYEVYAYSTRFGESSEGSKITFTLDFPTMEAPGNQAYTIDNGNDITLKWDGVTYAKQYKIYQIINGEKVLLRTVSGKITQLPNMPEGDYAYEVYSYSDRFGESATGSKISFSLIHPIMQAPVNPSYSMTNGNDITLRWNTATYATGYKVYRIIDGEKVLQRTVTGTATTFTNMPEGEYHYVVHSYSDRFGESPEGSVLDFTLVFPIMQAPGTLTKTITSGNDITLRWNTATYAKEYRVYQVIDGKKVLKRTLTGTVVSFGNMSEGEYHFVVHSYSDRFGESPVGSTVEFSLTWPIVQAPTLQGTVFNANNMTLSWPSVTWANEYRVYKVNGENKELIYKGTALSYKVYNLTEDTHTFEVTAYSNRFGESAASNRLEQKIVYPIMGVPNAKLTLLSDTSARITWDFVTYANGYNIYEMIDGKPVLLVEKLNNLSYTIQNLTYANHEYYVTSYSNSFGQSKPSEIVIAKLIVDTVAPETKINAPTKWVNQNQSLTLEATDDETGVAKTFYSVNDGLINEGTSILVEKEGINKISYNSIDKVGNMEQVKTSFVKIDKTAPVTDINEVPEYAQSFTVQLTGQDELSGVAKTYYSINGSEYIEGTSVVIEEEGTHEISYYSVDEAGNKEEVKTAEIKIDKTAPTTSSDAPETWVGDDVTVTLSPVDVYSGIAKTYYSINGSEYEEGTSVAINQEGINEIAYYSVDAVGNKEEVKTVEVKIDKTAPASSSDEPKTWVKDDVTVTLSAVDEHSGVEKTYYSINGLEYVEGTTVVVEQEGINEISYYSVDAVGNKEEVNTVEVKVDKTAATTTSDKPLTWVKDDVTVTLTAVDEHSGVGKTYYSINGSEFAEGTSFVVNQEGVNSISYYSVDIVGNKEEVKTAEVKVDKTAPKTADNAPETWVKEDVTVDLAATDDHSGVAKTYYSINGSDYTEGTSITITEEGINGLSYYSVDQAGNKEGKQSTTVKIDKTAPAVSMNLKTEYELGSTLTLDYRTEDLLSGIAVEEVTVNGTSYKKGDQLTLGQPGEYKLVIKGTDVAGWTTTVEKTFVVYIPVTLEVLPKVIKDNKGTFTVKATLPTKYRNESFDISTITLNGVSPDRSNKGMQKQAEKGHFKFEREDFDWTTGEQKLEFRGYINGQYLVVGKTIVEVKGK